MADDMRSRQLIDGMDYGRIPFFQGLSKEYIDNLKPNLQIADFKAGEMIFREGDPADAFYVIVAGEAKVFIGDGKSGTEEIAKLAKNACFGETALLIGSPRAASVQAATDVTVVKLMKQDFDKIMKQNQDLAAQFAGMLAGRLMSVRHEVYEPKLTPKEVHAKMTQSGVGKATAQGWQLFFLALLGGIYISLGAHAFLTAIDQGAGRITGGVVFSIGLILVILTEAELFTGNIIMMVGLLSSRYQFKNVLKNFQVVYFGNFVGSILFALVIFQTGLFGDGAQPTTLGLAAAKAADAKLSLSFAECFVRGIFCNILVILAVIMAIFAKDIISKMFCCLLPVMVFVASGFEHCIANMYLIPIGLLSKGAPLSDQLMIFRNIIPVTLGNIAGGLFIIFIHPMRIGKIISRLATEPAEKQAP